jgi:hypothetical protein
MPTRREDALVSVNAWPHSDLRVKSEPDREALAGRRVDKTPHVMFEKYNDGKNI